MQQVYTIKYGVKNGESNWSDQAGGQTTRRTVIVVSSWSLLVLADSELAGTVADGRDVVSPPPFALLDAGAAPKFPPLQDLALPPSPYEGYTAARAQYGYPVGVGVALLRRLALDIDPKFLPEVTQKWLLLLQFKNLSGTPDRRM
ncbi:hypothetical protein BC834DRAFT_975361 [Gloeopeniophorella convolvens]|nr:hypothetical protein BC834DRAFT_975361 [Gloeopeniophorella convolvens]